jgi:hypothetical protein
MIFKLFPKRPKGTLVGIVLILVAGAAVLLSSTPSVSAETGSGGTTQELRTYCQAHASDKLDPACSDANLKDIQNAAAQTSKCQSAGAGDFANCIVSEGERIIKQALSGAKTPKDFKSNLQAIFKKEGLDPSKDVANTSLNPDISCPSTGCGDDAIKCSQDKCDFIGRYINPAITAFTAAFGIVVVISLILGGIQYSSSAGDPQKVSQAKRRIFNTVVALVAYFFLYGFLQFLIPGGLFNRSGP